MSKGRRVLVLGGCGVQGQEAVRRLVASDVFGEILVADVDQAKAEQLVVALGQKVTFRKTDARDYHQVVSATRACDVVVNALGPFDVFGIDAIRAAIEAQVDYVDINDEADVTERLFAGDFDSLAKRAGISVVVGLGISPGLTNLLAKLGSKRLDRVDAIRIMSLSCTAMRGAAIWAHRLRLYSRDAIVFEHGRWVSVPPFSRAEAVDFLDLPQPVTCYAVPSPEPVTIPRNIPGVSEVSVKMAHEPKEVMAFIRGASQLGLTQEQPIELRGVALSPLEFLATYLASDIAENAISLDNRVVFGKEIVIEGERDAKPVRGVYRCKYESSARITGFLAAIGAEFLAAGIISRKGLLAPEALDPEPFAREFSNLGLVVHSTWEAKVRD